MLGSISHLAEAISLDLKKLLPKQRKTQRRKLALLVSTMLQARTANTMDLAAHLPLETERQDMKYQWISRFLSNPLVNPEEIMMAIDKPLLEKIAKNQPILVLIIDQTKVNDDEELLVVSVRVGARALPLMWKAKETQGNIDFQNQKQLLDQVANCLPQGTKVILLGDRFYGTSNLIEYCQNKNWDYRLRLRNNIKVFYGLKECLTGDLEGLGLNFLQNVCLTHVHQQTNIGIIHEPGHTTPWIIAMNRAPSFYTTFDYGMRWSIEPMFSDFKSRGFGLTDTHIVFADRVERLVLIMAIAMIWAVLSGLWHANFHPLPCEKRFSKKPFAVSFPISNEDFVS